MVTPETLKKARKHIETRKEFISQLNNEQVELRDMLGGMISIGTVLDIMDILIAGEYEEFERKLDEMGYYDLVS